MKHMLAWVQDFQPESKPQGPSARHSHGSWVDKGRAAEDAGARWGLAQLCKAPVMELKIQLPALHTCDEACSLPVPRKLWLRCQLHCACAPMLRSHAAPLGPEPKLAWSFRCPGPTLRCSMCAQARLWQP